MDDRTSASRWSRIETLFDEAIGLPAAERQAFLEQRTGGDAALLRDVQSMLVEADHPDALFEHPAADVLARGAPLASLAPGTRVGAWRVVAFVGRGGMGEVFRVERADAAFVQHGALKLIRREAVDQIERFHEERRLLARLDHPGIAHLLDGGVADDGRPFMVMEWVEGISLTEWCRIREADLRQRLELVLQVCEAVAYAHRNLLVHRDVKPANVLVTADGRARLLDFGIAKLLTADAEQTLTHAPLTLAYAAPEQLTQSAVTPATDVYSIGVVLYELLTGERPWQRSAVSLPVQMQRQIREPPPTPSVAAAKADTPPFAPRLLRGDLDAITANALRPEPERRYRSAAELADDLRRHLEGRPVLARPESLRDAVERFMRRNRVAAAFALLAIAGLVIGLAAALWQAHEARTAARLARQEAARATVTRNFLVRVFRASDPRIASDKPRGQITARELLDLNAPDIRKEFADDPATQVELLGIAASIYRELGDETRYLELHGQQVDVARTHFGDLHPSIIDGLLDDADHANDRNDYDQARRLLGEAEVLIRRAGLDRSVRRARWGLIRADVLEVDDADREAGARALDEAIALYASIAPGDPDHVRALIRLGYRHIRSDPPQAQTLFERAIATAGGMRDVDASELQQLAWPGLAQVREARGDYPGARAAYERGAELARQTYGEAHSSTWTSTAEFAWMLHRYGERDRALALFEHLMSLIPPDWTTDSFDEYAREFYATALAAEGRAAAAVPMLEAARRAYIEKPGVDYELRRIGLSLGDAYDRVGRTGEARTTLQATLAERLEKDVPGSRPIRAIRERWGRFLLDHGDPAGAEAQFREVLASAPDTNYVEVAQAHAGLARLALARGDAAAADAESRSAVERFDHVTGQRDVRTGPALWLVRAQVLAAAGDRAGAHALAQRALDASRTWDAPGAASIQEAEAASKATGASP